MGVGGRGGEGLCGGGGGGQAAGGGGVQDQVKGGKGHIYLHYQGHNHQ